jgi:hypothetical protein
MARQHKRSACQTCREVRDQWTRCAQACTVCSQRVPLLGASEDLSGLESRDQMASDRKRDGLLNAELAEEARGLQLGDPHRQRYSSPTETVLERIRAGQ